MRKNMPNLAMILIIVAILILDQVTKFIIKSSMHVGQSFPVLGNFFRITFVENPGMAFGARLDNPLVFLGLSVVAAVLVFYYLIRLRSEGWFLQLALSFIAAGAIGNLFDRFVYGKVVDFLDFEFWDVIIPSFKVIGWQFPGYNMTRWPVFNVADMAVTSGMVIIILYLLIIGDPLKNPQKTSVNAADGSENPT